MFSPQEENSTDEMTLKIEWSTMKILIVYAHPEPTSLTHQMVQTSIETLESLGHEVMLSDLYGMKWKAVYDEQDFPERADLSKLSLIQESYNAFSTGKLTQDVLDEQAKLTQADAVIFQFPLWWFGMPAILKGWIDRVYAYGFGYGYKNEGNKYRYGEGALKGKRALVSVLTGGPEHEYSARGIHGPIDHILFPLTHGALFYPGMDVLPTFTIHGINHITSDGVAAAKENWKRRVENIFNEKPIAFRTQNGGDYERNVLKTSVAVGKLGMDAHISSE